MAEVGKESVARKGIETAVFAKVSANAIRELGHDLGHGEEVAREERGVREESEGVE